MPIPNWDEWTKLKGKDEQKGYLLAAKSIDWDSAAYVKQGERQALGAAIDALDDAVHAYSNPQDPDHDNIDKLSAAMERCRDTPGSNRLLATPSFQLLETEVEREYVRRDIAEQNQPSVEQQAINQEIANSYVLPEHMEAIAAASRKGNFAISFRESGAPTLQKLNEGAAAKPHDILEKTVKKSSLESAYGAQRGGEILTSLRQHNVKVEGCVGHWDEETGQLKGLYVVDPKALPKALQDQCQPVPDSEPPQHYYPVDVDNLDASLNPLGQVPKWQRQTYTGDYDTHDAIRFSGQRHTVPSDSQEEAEIIKQINKEIGKIDQDRAPVKPSEHSKLGNTNWTAVQHGPQVNYVAHMLDKEKGETLKKPVAEASFPVAMCNRGEWSVIKNQQQLEQFYKDNAIKLKESWKNEQESRRFIDVGDGAVKTFGHKDQIESSKERTVQGEVMGIGDDGTVRIKPAGILKGKDGTTYNAIAVRANSGAAIDQNLKVGAKVSFKINGEDKVTEVKATPKQELQKQKTVHMN